MNQPAAQHNFRIVAPSSRNTQHATRAFVLTPTAKKIQTACDLARESRTVVFVWGSSHIGKTWAVEDYCREARSQKPEVRPPPSDLRLPTSASSASSCSKSGLPIYVRLPAATGLAGLVRAIAAALAVSAPSRAETIARIKDTLAPGALLILDECHLLAHTCRPGSFHNCMEVIRELHDETNCGLVLIFTLLDRVRAASQKELQQLWRRGVHKVQLASMPTKSDLAAILENHGLKFPDRTLTIPIRAGREILEERPYEILRQLAREEALLAITERLRYAKKLAARANEKMDWPHFIDAHLRIAKNAEPEGEWE
jgi:DNA transposition AAA+ family ATPase